MKLLFKKSKLLIGILMAVSLIASSCDKNETGAINYQVKSQVYIPLLAIIRFLLHCSLQVFRIQHNITLFMWVPVP